MKNLFFAFLILAVIPFTASAQKTEVGLFGGVSNYMGELSGANIEISETNPAVGGLLRYYLNPFINVRVGITYGVISGADANASSESKRIRNLSFRSDILEVAFIPEINIIGFRGDKHLFSPYIFGGVAGFYFNPKTWYKGEWVELQPLGTEGQGIATYPEEYSLMQLSFPFGGGFKFGFNNGLNIGIEAGARYTLTDYLDDVSTSYVDPAVLLFGNGALAQELANRTDELPGQEGFVYADGDPRGNPDTQDWYMFGGVTITYTIGAGNGLGGGKGKRGCPIY